MGSVTDAGTSAISWGEPDSEVMSQAAPTDWISPPKFEARLANQTALKMGVENGDGGLVESASVTGRNEAEMREPVKSRLGIRNNMRETNDY